MSIETIVGIETSCDETSVAVLRINKNKIEVFDHVIYSQIEDHKKYGGVVPEQAARKHLEILPAMLKKMNIDFSEVDYIAVTAGPGLVTSLMVGIDVAKTLAWRHDIPLIPVNHVYGHLLAAELPTGKRGGTIERIPLPTLGLIVSGGHTELVMLDSKWRATIIGRTRDDAAGEAFDKAARLLHLPYPGGPSIEKFAKHGDPKAYDLPRPMEKHHDTYDYSFSGLKNAVRLQTEGKRLTRAQTASFAASFQQAVVDSLIIKFDKGIVEKRPRSIIMGGGVANNTALRQAVGKLGKRHSVPSFLAPRQYSGDNAAMIAWAGYRTKKNAIRTRQFTKLRANPQLSYER